MLAYYWSLNFRDSFFILYLVFYVLFTFIFGFSHTKQNKCMFCYKLKLFSTVSLCNWSCQLMYSSQSERMTLFPASHNPEIVRCCKFEMFCNRFWQLMAVGSWRHWLQRERRERAFNLDPNWPLHLSTTQGVNQHLSNKSGDKGGEKKKEREGNEQWYKWKTDWGGVDWRDGKREMNS